MTNTSNANIEWEVAGAKKIFRKSDLDTQTKKSVNNAKLAKEFVSKIPRLESLPPLKASVTIFDYIRPEDDEQDENNNPEKLTNKKPTIAKNDINSPTIALSTSSAKPKVEKDSINLLATSVLANQKKKPTTIATKKPEAELESAIANLNVETFQQVYSQLEGMPQYSYDLIVKHIVSELNMALNKFPDIDPSANHDNFYPACKLDKKLEKFLASLVARLKRTDAESVFDYCFNSLFNENQKILSNHGHRIFLQLLIKHTPNIFVNSIPKYVEFLNANRHRHQRVLLALWAFAQVGYFNLGYGIKVWLDGMLPFIGIKNAPAYVATYLSYLLDYHKVSSSSDSKLTTSIDLDQYMRLHDLVNEKTLVLSKDATSRVKNSFQILRDLFMKDLATNGTQYFENLLSGLSEQSSRYTENLDILARILLSNKNAHTVWRSIYAKHTQQSLELLEYLTSNYNRQIKTMREMRDTLNVIEEQTSAQLRANSNSASSSKDTPRQHHFASKKAKQSSTAVELERVRKLNRQTKQLLNRNFQQTSWFSMVLRSLLLVLLATGFFFYWDVNQNKSAYVNSIEKELGKYGLLEPTLRLVESVKKFYLNVQGLAYYYIPIWYKKTSDVVIPYSRTAYNFTRTYAQLAWNTSEPYVNTALLYVQQAKDYTVENYPSLIKNLESVMQLVINYATTLINFFLQFAKVASDLVGVKLLGWNKGEMEKIFLDAFRFGLEYITVFFQWLNTNLSEANLTE